MFGLVGLAGLEFLFQMGAPVGLHLFEFAFGDQAFGDQALAIELRRRLVGADDLVHHRLGERRLVAFVVAEAAIAEHVDDDRLVELLPEFGGDLGGVDHRFRIVAVDVEDRRLDHLGDVGRIGRRAREDRIGGEADLVVDDEMHRAADAMTAQARQAEAFGDHALAGKGGIAMQQQRHHLSPLGQRDDVAFEDLRHLVLLGAGLAHDHRIDDFEMRRVGRQRQMHLVAVELAVRGSTEMVLHVARAFDVVRGGGAALELVEHRAVRLAHDVGQHVQTAAMGHAEDDFLEAFLAAALDDLLERRDQRFAAVEAEALGALVLDVDELLEAFGLDQLLQDRLLAFRRELDVLVRTFDALLDPGL